MSFALLAFPSDTAAMREERAFDQIVSVVSHGRLPDPRLRIRTVNGLDTRWLTNAVVVVHAAGLLPVAGKITQWRGDDLRDFVATLGEPCPVANAAIRDHVPPEGCVAIVSGGRSRVYPMNSPAP